MAGVLTAVILGHTASGINYTLTFTQAVADSATAQTNLNQVKTFLAGGSTIDLVTADFQPANTPLS